VANDANCDNGLFCDGAETCDALNDCQPGGDPCPGQGCDEATDTCVDCLVDADCDNGLFCDGAETCVAGTCQPGTPVDCNDGVGCTDDSCNEATDSCDNVANDANCDNGQFCDGSETCDAINDCQAGTPVSDGVGCTDDSCDEAADACVNVANDANCPDDGAFCNGTEFCDPVNDCSSTGDPCPAGTTCDETTDTCQAAEGDVYLDRLRAPKKKRLTERKVTVDLEIIAKGDGSTEQMAEVCITQEQIPGPGVNVTFPNGSNCDMQLVVPGDGSTTFVVAADMKCSQLDGNTYDVVWTATISADQNSDPSNDSLDATTRVTCVAPDGGGGGPGPGKEKCKDGVDNDGDELVDCDDPDCAGKGQCP
jgi:hypothetical protein